MKQFILEQERRSKAEEAAASASKVASVQGDIIKELSSYVAHIPGTVVSHRDDGNRGRVDSRAASADAALSSRLEIALAELQVPSLLLLQAMSYCFMSIIL